MTNKRLKDWVIPALTIFVFLGTVLCYYLVSKLVNYNVVEDQSYVTETLIDNSIPVNKEVEKITQVIKPYENGEVKVSKFFYQSTDDETRQTNSLIKYENIYMPNTGILYVSDSQFDVVSVLDGKVTTIKEDEILGKIIEIEHDNGYITIYQSVSDVTVNIGDEVTQGTIIAKSGTNKLDEEKANCLHFETYKDGNLINPEEFYNTNLG